MNSTPIGFTGEHQDPVTLTYPLGNGYRWYLPGIMRFNAPDALSPFGAGGIHPYAYCAADPVNCTDPTGHMFKFSLDEAAEFVRQVEHQQLQQQQLQAEEDAIRRIFGMPADTSTQTPATHVGAADHFGQAPGPSSSVPIAVHRAGGDATGIAPFAPDGPPPKRPRIVPAPGDNVALPSTSAGSQAAAVPRPANAPLSTEFEQILKASTPDRPSLATVDRERAVRLTKELKARYPGRIKPITEVPGYNQRVLREWLGACNYQSFKTSIRAYARGTTKDAHDEWMEAGPYLGVDMSGIR